MARRLHTKEYRLWWQPSRSGQPVRGWCGKAIASHVDIGTRVFDFERAVDVRRPISFIRGLFDREASETRRHL